MFHLSLSQNLLPWQNLARLVKQPKGELTQLITISKTYDLAQKLEDGHEYGFVFSFFWQPDMEVISSSVVETLNGRPSQPKS